jgi:hypothetical protein
MHQFANGVNPYYLERFDYYCMIGFWCIRLMAFGRGWAIAQCDAWSFDIAVLVHV